MHTAYITHPDCLEHDTGAHHPESPARLRAIEDQLIASGLLAFLQHHDAPLATFEQLARVHAPHYIETVRSASPTEGLVYLDPDTAMNPFTLSAALRAAGAVVLATDLVLEGADRPAAPACTGVRRSGFPGRRGVFFRSLLTRRKNFQKKGKECRKGVGIQEGGGEWLGTTGTREG